MPSPLLSLDVPLPPSPPLEQQDNPLLSDAQLPMDAPEIQEVTLAFTQASCDNSQATIETVPAISENTLPCSHDTASSVRDLSAMDSVFAMIHSLFEEPWTMLYEDALAQIYGGHALFDLASDS